MDQFSIDLFNRTDRAVSTVNIWAMELVPGRTFTYELSRPTGRLFRVEFDLTQTVDAAPAVSLEEGGDAHGDHGQADIAGDGFRIGASGLGDSTPPNDRYGCVSRCGALSWYGPLTL